MNNSQQTELRMQIPPIQNPFTVIVDTREQAPYSFTGFRADEKHRVKSPESTKDNPVWRTPSLYIPTEKKTLKSGDYSIEGYESQISIERKSLQDLYGTLGQGRDRFVRELERLSQFQIADIVIESGFESAIRNPPKNSSLNPKTVFRSINAWKQEYRNIHWNFCDSRGLAEHVTFRILERFWRKQQEKQSQKTENPESCK